MKHKHAAVLIAGSEDRHKKSISEIEIYLSGIGVDTVVHNYDSAELVISSIALMGAKLTEKDILLIVIHAHGSKSGIESPGVFRSLSYSKIIAALPRGNKRVQFVTATCYGHFLIKKLIGKRSGYTTGVITTWEGFKTTYEGTVTVVREAWSVRKLPEEVIKQVFSSYEFPFDCDFSGVQRWGTMHDKYFFAPA